MRGYWVNGALINFDDNILICCRVSWCRRKTLRTPFYIIRVQVFDIVYSNNDCFIFYVSSVVCGVAEVPRKFTNTCISSGGIRYCDL